MSRCGHAMQCKRGQLWDHRSRRSVFRRWLWTCGETLLNFSGLSGLVGAEEQDQPHACTMARSPPTYAWLLNLDIHAPACKSDLGLRTVNLTERLSLITGKRCWWSLVGFGPFFCYPFRSDAIIGDLGSSSSCTETGLLTISSTDACSFVQTNGWSNCWRRRNSFLNSKRGRERGAREGGRDKSISKRWCIIMHLKRVIRHQATIIGYQNFDCCTWWCKIGHQEISAVEGDVK
jgi:hypothetical protein